MFKNFFKTKLKVSTDYLIVFAIIMIGIITMSAAMTVNVYKSNLSLQHNLVEQTALKADGIISEFINEHHWQIRSVADRIMKSGGDLETINQIISNHNKFDPESNFNQFLNQKDMMWIDTNDNLAIKNKVGILQYPARISNSYEVFNSRNQPWKLIISHELPSKQNGYNLILTSFGVTDKNGKYLGSIISSIDISLLQNLLIKQIPQLTNDEILLLSSYDKKIIFGSNPNSLVDLKRNFTHELDVSDYENNLSGYVKENIIADDIKYPYYKKLSNYPITILSGYNYQNYNTYLNTTIFKAIYPIFLIGSFLIIALFLFYKRIVQPIDQLSQIARNINFENSLQNKKLPKINSPEIFELAKALLKIRKQKIKLHKTKHQLEEAIEVIKSSDIAQIEILKQIKNDITKNTEHVFSILNMLKHNVENGLKQDNKINLFLIQSLERGIENITKFATDELNKENVDIKEIINRAVLSQQKEIKIRNIKFDVIYSKNLPRNILADQTRLTQAISAILHKTITLLSEENYFTIEVKTATKNTIKYISINIKDNGIGIGFKDHAIAAKTMGKKDDNSVNAIDISIETIEELVKLHQGEIFYNNQIHQGSSTTITIPYHKNKKEINSPSREKKESKIINFPLRS